MWFYYALTFAISSSLITIIAKNILSEVNEYLFIWLQRIFTILFLSVAIIFLFKIPHTDLTFWIVMLFSSLLSALGAFCDYKAIKISEVSLIAPIAAFNPIFTTIISFVFLKEQIGILGVVGITVIVIGAYLLKLSEAKNDFLAPIKALYNSPGVRLALLGSVVWSINPILFKIAISHTTPNTPPFISFIGLSVSGILFTPFLFKLSKNNFPKVKNFLFAFLGIGVLGAVGEIAGFNAYNMANLGYVTAIFRLSMVFTVIFGWIFYKEKGIEDKLLGTLIMLVGVVLLVVN